MYQKITIVGNLGGDPEMRYLPNGKAVTNFSVATNRRWTGQDGEKKEETCWFRVSAWERQAETCNQYLSKGRQVMVEGTIQPDPETGGPRTYTRNDGTVGASFEVRASRVIFLSGGSESASPAGAPAQNEEDEIPF